MAIRTPSHRVDVEISGAAELHNDPTGHGVTNDCEPKQPHRYFEPRTRWAGADQCFRRGTTKVLELRTSAFF